MTHQNDIFQDRPRPEEKPSARKKLYLSWIAAPVRAVLQAIRHITLLAAFFMFIWGMIGEQFLPHHFRFTTFLVERLSNIENGKNKKTARIEADKAEAIAAAQQAVELRKTCEVNRQAGAQAAYQSCMARPRSLITGCAFLRDHYLQSVTCGQFTAELLSPDTYNHLQQEGVLQ